MSLIHTILRSLERATAGVFASVVVKLCLVACFAFIAYLMMPLDLLSWECALLLGAAIFVWFIEFEAGLLTSLVLSRLPDEEQSRKDRADKS